MEQRKQDDWMQTKWRPAMGWMYTGVCVMDFVVFPILWSILQSLNNGSVQTQWQPLTLQGAGLFHMAMGAVLGIAAFGRTQEKLAGYGQTSGTVYVPPSTQDYQPPYTDSNTTMRVTPRRKIT